MGIKSGWLSLHTAGVGTAFELTNGQSNVSGGTRQYCIFNQPFGDPLPGGGQFGSDRLVSFPNPAFSSSFSNAVGGGISPLPSGSAYPSGTIAVSASAFTYVVPGLITSGTLYAPIIPFGLNADGKPSVVTAPNTAPESGYGIRIGLWSAPVGGTYLENVQFGITPAFTQSAAGNIDFAPTTLVVLP